ncbi:hypothetical protein GJ744_001815 [Endocarpon pusillum]|uniref:Uncharacterized protein n=1 Tax=Endocarpon pusillum TaxID=364733 RepID=A0A8H7E7L3_9EURO|nr:hypothetical protein GJ744_001815 [Endocarpon pusillum]
MSNSYDSDNQSTFLSVPSEVRCMIYKEVFAGARIVLPASKVPRRSRRLNGKLIALLQVCRVCHLEATPILYSNAVMKVAGPLAAGTLDRGLRNEHFHRIRTIVASATALDGKQMGRQLREFPALRKITFQLGSQPTLDGNKDGQAIQLVVCAEISKLKVTQMYLWIEWLVRSGISVHVTFEIWHWTTPRTSVHYIDYNINNDVTVISPEDPFE